MHAEAEPRLSVMVTSYTMSRFRDLKELLDSLQAQSYQDFEIIFVGEKDAEMCDRLRSYTDRRGVRNLRILFNDGTPGISAARDLGLRNARAELVAFIDDDAVALPGWAEQIVGSFSDESIVGITGPALPLWVDGVSDWFPQELYWILGCTGWYEADVARDVRNVWGMNMAFRREALSAAHSFSEEMGAVQGKRLHGEEVDLSLRVRKETGRRLVFDSNVKVMHKVYSRRLSATWIAKTSYWTGHTRHRLSQLSKSYGITDDFLSVERRLLGRIVRRLLPKTMAALFVTPRQALHVLWIVALALSFVALGYASQALSSLLADMWSMAGRRGERREGISH